MAINKIIDRVVTEWDIDPGDSKKEIKNLNKLYENQIKELKELEKANKALDRSYKTQVNSLNTLKNGVVAFQAKVSLVTGALGAVKDAFSATLELSSDYNKALGAYKGNLDDARQATQGLVTDLQLMKTANQLNTLGVKLSNEEYATLLQGVTKLSDAMGITMEEALSSTATALSRQSIQVADNIGVTMKLGEAQEAYAASVGKTTKELTDNEKKLAFQQEFLRQVAEKAGELPPKLTTLTDALTKADTSIVNTFTKWAAHIDRSIGLALDNLINKIKTLKTGVLGEETVKGMLDEDRAAKLKANFEAAQAGLGLGAEASKAQLKAASLGGGEGDVGTNLMGLPRVLGRGEFKEGAEFSTLSAKIDKQMERQRAAAAEKRRRAREAERKADEQAAEEHSRFMERIVEEDIKAQDEYHRRLHENELARQRDLRATADAFMKMKEDQKKLIEQEKAAAEAASVTGKMRKRAAESFETAKMDTINTATSAFSSLGSAMFAAAEAAEATGEGFASSLGKIVKSTLKGVAITSTVKALESLALAAFNAAMLRPFEAGLALKAAGMYTATALVAGGMAAAIPGGGGGTGGGGGASRARVGRGLSEDAQRQRPQFAKKEEARAPINIDLYIGDPQNPSSALVAREQLNAQLSQRKQSEFSEI